MHMNSRAVRGRSSACAGGFGLAQGSMAGELVRESDNVTSSLAGRILEYNAGEFLLWCDTLSLFFFCFLVKVENATGLASYRR